MGVTGECLGTHIILIEGGPDGMSRDDVLRRAERRYPGAALAHIMASGAAPGGFGVVVVGVTALVQFASPEEAAEQVRAAAHRIVPALPPGVWTVYGPDDELLDGGNTFVPIIAKENEERLTSSGLQTRAPSTLTRR